MSKTSSRFSKSISLNKISIPAWAYSALQENAQMKKGLNSSFLMLMVLLLNACSASYFHKSNRLYRKEIKTLTRKLRNQPSVTLTADSLKMPGSWVGTVNMGLRKPNLVILHHTAQTNCDKTLHTFASSGSQVSAHYVICKEGTVHHMLNDYMRAWHAGAGKWGNITDVNSCSIGIEIDNNGSEPFTAAQLNVLLGLLDTLKKQFNIPAANFIGHADIAPSRKNDPNVHFPWKRLSEKGFGLWYDDTTAIVLPTAFDEQQALRIIGYNIADIDAAILAFRRHFLRSEITGPLSVEEKKVLYCLMKKYL